MSHLRIHNLFADTFLALAGANFRPSEWNGHCEDWPEDVDIRRASVGCPFRSAFKLPTLTDTSAVSVWVLSQHLKFSLQRHPCLSQHDTACRAVLLVVFVLMGA